MNQLALGIGLSGKYEVNIDGMKSQLEAEKAAAEQAVAARKARDKETSDVLKSATDFLGTSKVAPMYKEAAMSAYQGTIQKMSSLVKDGTFGLEANKELVKLKEILGHYVASSDEFYKSQNDLSPGVRDMFNDPKGLERATSVAFENAQTSYFFGDKNEHQVVFPVKSKSPISDWKTALNAQKIADTEPIKGTERSFTIPNTNSVQYEQKYGLNPVAQKQFVNKDVATLLNAQNISDTLKEYYGGLKQEYFENGPEGQGLVPTQAVIADITKMVNDGYSGRYEELKNFSGSIQQPKTEKASTYDKAFIPPGQPWASGGEKGFDYGQAGTTARKAQVTAPAGTKQRVNGKYQDYNGGKEIVVEATPIGPVVIRENGKDLLKFRYNVPTGQGQVDQILIGGDTKGFVDFTTHMGITRDEKELDLLLSGIGNIVSYKKDELIEKYVKALAANGVKITFPTSTPAATPAKPSGSPAATKPAKYNIKGKEYSLEDLVKMGYTEQQVEQYKTK
jgi:hypothetical protein